MSRYLMNKFMRHVLQDDERLRAYIADPPGFVEQWTRGHGHGVSHELPEAERRALAERDYVALYALGAHPFLLWSFTEAVWVHEVPRPELIRRYNLETARFGHPDFTT